MSDNQFCVVYVTVNEIDIAKKIATVLVEKKLAACCSILPEVESIYYWDGKVQNDSEFLLMIKSHFDKFDRVEEEILKVHTYDIPEIIAIPIVKGSEKYLAWLKDTINL